MSLTVNAFLTATLAEIRMARAGDVVNAEDLDLTLLLFNELLDALNADSRAVYTRGFPTFTLTPGLNPHTIGLAANTPTFAVPIGAPRAVAAANLILAAPSSLRVPLSIRDDAWWMDVRARTVSASVPRDLFYSTDWPNGSLFLWPVPSVAYGLELETATLLAQVALADTLDLPFGYQQALRLTLAELAASSFGQTVSQTTKDKARDARALVWGANDLIPNAVTRDAGMPGGRGGGFNFLTGQVG